MSSLTSLRTVAVRLVALAVVGCALLTAGFAAAPSAHADDRSSFVLPVLPDTQFYSRYATPEYQNLFLQRYGTEPFDIQTGWLAANRNALNMPFVVHLGDIVDRSSKTDEWVVADRAMARLESVKLPYSILAGNHDVGGSNYLSRFSATRAAKQATFGGRDASGMHEWHTFTAEGRTFLVLSLSWQPNAQAIAWARQVLADHPTLPTIFATHELISVGGDGVSAIDTTWSDKLWDELIRDNDQIFLTLNGHFHGATHKRRTNDFGHSVDQILLDYQMAYQGGNGYLGLLEFDFTNNRLDTTVVSPWIRHKPIATRVPRYDVPVRPGTHENLSLAIDWNARFAGFAAPVTPAAPSHGSLLDRAKQLVREGVDEAPSEDGNVAPADRDDYPKVPGTLAHWRFGGAPGTVAPGSVVEDIAGDNDLTRAALDADGPQAAQAGDVRRSDDRPYLSADPGSICFADTAKSPMRVSYLRTGNGAPINAETFPNGYTIESFIKIDDGWQPGSNAWMGALTREGRRGEIPGLSGSDPDEPVFTLAISNLREIQWNGVAANPLTDRTNWSGEVMPGTWLHVAAVNDPQTRMTTLYVDGAPVLRNAVDGIGLATAGKPWRIGSATWEGLTTDGWLGCVGETRIVDHPLSSDHWLTARVHETGGETPVDPGTPVDPETPGEGTPQEPGGDRPAPPLGTPVPDVLLPPNVLAPKAKALPAAKIRATSVTVRKRTLRVRVSGRASVRVALHRCTTAKRCAKRATRSFSRTARKASTLSVVLPNAVKPGRYRVVVTVRAGGKSTKLTRTVRVPVTR